MYAQNLHDIGDLRFEEVEKPQLGKGMVLVKVMAAGICGSDIARVYTTGAHRMPLIPGHEFSGIVVETYSRKLDFGECVRDENGMCQNPLVTGCTVSQERGEPKQGEPELRITENGKQEREKLEQSDDAWLGKRVGIFPLIPCMKCPQCQKKQYEMCRNYNYLGSRTDGGFAEYVAVPEWNLMELPEEVSYEQAAMLEPASVAMHAIRAMQVQREEAVAVCGLGTIGLLAAMHLKGLGVEKVHVLGNKEAQRRMAARIGIAPEDFCDTKVQEPLSWLAEKTNGRGVDVFFECIGKNEIVNLAIRAVTPGGRVMLVGNPASDMMLEKAVYWQILRKQLTLKGTWNSSYLREEGDDWHQVLRAIADGRIHPEELITHRLSLEDLPKGLEIMRDKTEDYVKIMVTL